jgi:hypothetical protein
MTEDNILDILLREKRELRDEIIAMQKSIHRIVFVFLTVAVAVAGIFFNQYFSSNTEYKGYLTFILIQIEIGMSTFLISLIAHQNVSAGYIAAIENKINKIAGKNYLIYENKLSPIFTYGLRGPSIYTIIITVIFYLAVLFTLIYIGYSTIAFFWFGIVLTLEIIIVLVLLFWGYLSIKQVKAVAEKLMEESC